MEEAANAPIVSRLAREEARDRAIVAVKGDNMLFQQELILLHINHKASIHH